MSLRAWNRLSDEQKSALTEAAQETAREYPEVAQQEEREQLDLIEQEMTVIEPNQIDMEAFQQVFRERGLPRLRQEYGEGPIRWVEAVMNTR